MKEKILKYLIYVSGLICLCVFLSLRVLPLYNAVLTEKMHPEYFEFTKYGEQYYKSYIKHFREDLPTPIDKYRLSKRNAKLSEANIIAFGDSFFDFSRQKTVPERLHDSLNVKVHTVRGYYPFDYLHDRDYATEETKIIIYEVIERDIHARFFEPQKFNKTWNDGKDYNNLQRKTIFIRKNIFVENAEELYSVLLKGSVFTSGIYSWMATVKFNLFKYIPPATSLYSLTAFDFPVLFWGMTVNDENTSFYYDHSDSLINTYCDNMIFMARNLKELYNLDMVFLAIPNKYTMWHKKINPKDEYDNFLPRLYKEMDKRNIQHVDIYHDFLKSDTILYYGTDSHWNKNGVDIAVENILEHFRKNKVKIN